jgi:hypothetical protein
MFFQNMVALSMETNLARLLSVRGREVQRWGEVKFPAGSVKDARITDVDGVAAALDGLFRSTGVSRKGVLVSISGFRSMTRTVTLPEVSGNLLGEAVQWAAQREMTVPLREIYLSWQVTGSRDKEHSVYLIGTPRDIFDPLYRVLRQVDIRPQVVELKATALSRIVNQNEAVLIDLEEESTDVIIVADGIPEVTHTTVIKAEDLLLEERLHKVIGALGQAFTFFKNAHPEHPLGAGTPVYLTGALMDNPETGALLRESIRQPIEALPRRIKQAPDFPLARYAVNIGLALRRIKTSGNGRQAGKHLPRINMNIMPVTAGIIREKGY